MAVSKHNQKSLNRLIELESRKTVHTSLSATTHIEFRKILLEAQLSMQEVFEFFAALCALEDRRALSILAEAKERKKEKSIKSLTQREQDALYKTIAESDPFDI